MTKGKLIVIEGGDGSGKATQAKLLTEYLQKQNKLFKFMDFPQYYDSFFGKTVAKFMRGDFGKIDEVSPYLASLPFAMDRESVKNEMNEFLEKGGTIVTNRYATSNKAHQSVKFSDPQERKEFMEWVDELEYNVNKIPREDLVIYLYVPWEIGMELSKKREPQKYLDGKKDIHEEDIEHRKQVEKMYQQLAKNKNWITINCVENGSLLSIENIHQKIIEVLKKVAV